MVGNPANKVLHATVWLGYERGAREGVMADEVSAKLVRAVVVSPDELPEAKRVARFFCSIGVLREAFSDPDEAARWDRAWSEAFAQPVPPEESRP